VAVESLQILTTAARGPKEGFPTSVYTELEQHFVVGTPPRARHAPRGPSCGQCSYFTPIFIGTHRNGICFLPMKRVPAHARGADSFL
jgi:hypothetical protein